MRGMRVAVVSTMLLWTGPVRAGVEVVSTWTCGNGSWSDTACWDNLQPGDAFPDSDGGTAYQVVLPQGFYTVTVSVAGDNNVTVTELMVEPGATLQVQSGTTLSMASSLTSRGTLRSSGTLTADAAAVIDIDASNLRAEMGGTLSLPATSYVGSAGCSSETLRADGVGSLLDLSSVTSFDAATCSFVFVEARNGGVVDLSSLPMTVNGVALEADGPASTLQLDALTTIAPSDGSVTVAGGGTVVAPLLTAIQEGGLILDGTGNVIDLTLISDINGSDIVARNGAVVALPQVTGYTGSAGCASEMIRADGRGSVVDLSSVSSFDAETCSFVFVQAWDGGLVDLSTVPVTHNGVLFEAEGSASVLQLDALTTIAPKDAGVTLIDGGTVVAPALTAIQQGGLTLDGLGNGIDQSILADMDASDIIARNGAVIELPALTAYTASADCSSETLRADGPGSRVTLPALTVLDADACSPVFLQALSGGELDLRQSSAFGTIALKADDPGSVVHAGDLDMAISSSVTSTDSGAVITPGSFSYRMTASALFTWSADSVLHMTGAVSVPQDAYCDYASLEAASEDFGPGGFANNFELNDVIIGAEAHVTVVDCVDNLNRGGPAGSAEAVYAATLVLDTDAVLNLNGLHVYVGGNLLTAGAFGGGTIINARAPANLNNDCSVDAADLAQLLGSWGPCPQPCSPADGQPDAGCSADFNDDCVIDAFDLANLLGAWGDACLSAAMR